MELKSRRIKIGNSAWKVKLKDTVNGGLSYFVYSILKMGNTNT